MIYIPLWFKLFLSSQKQKALHESNTALFCAVYQGPKGCRTVILGSYEKSKNEKQPKKQKNKTKKTFPSYTNRKVKVKEKEKLLHCL